MIDFTHVEQSVAELKLQLTQNQLDERSFEERLLELVDVAEDGYYWMYGHESEQWFRHDGENWTPANPAQILAARANPAPTETGSPPDETLLGWGWFTASLGILIVIGATVYSASLG
jgi:hypothetical protein